jgi:hypothetical protein
MSHGHSKGMSVTGFAWDVIALGLIALALRAFGGH